MKNYFKRTHFISLLCFILFSQIIHSQPIVKQANSKIHFNTPISFEVASERAQQLLDKMTIDQKIELLGGKNGFFTYGFPELGIPSIYMVDATQGVRLSKKVILNENQIALDKSTSFPSPILLASTWNPDLAEAYAKSVGEECRAAGAGILLGPGMNIYRQSQCGRNFEYFGEDPFLVSRMIERYVVGMQNTGTMATIKHFVANNTDFYRRRSNSIVDERALHEIYLPAFQAGIDAGAMAVMTSYNLLNGEWCGQSEYVINELLRKEMGFKGLVMTDWNSVWDSVKVVRSGQDLEMPKRRMLANVKQLLDSGKVDVAQINRMAKSILTSCIAMGFFDRAQQDTSYLKTFNAHEKVALNVAREGIVLLKNDGNLLPLNKKSALKIVVTGKFVDSLAVGTGAAMVKGYNNVQLFDAIKAEFGNRVEKVAMTDTQKIKAADVLILSVGTQDGEFFDRPFDLPAKEDSVIQRVLLLNKNTIVVVNSGGGINMSHWIGKTRALLYAWYGAQTGNTALAEVISGAVNPSGKLPITIEKRFEDSPAFGYIPEGEAFYTGRSKEELTHKLYDVHYNEGVFVGYRWYENKKIEPLFAFGSGLSYSTFKYSNLKVTPTQFAENEQVEVVFNVKNTSKIVGNEIAQVYIQDVESSVSRPLKELKGFKKLNLAAGEQKEVRITLLKKDFSFWDTATKAWKAEPGKFIVLVGGASDKIQLKAEIALK